MSPYRVRMSRRERKKNMIDDGSIVRDLTLPLLLLRDLRKPLNQYVPTVASRFASLLDIGSSGGIGPRATPNVP